MAGAALAVETKQAASSDAPGLMDRITADIRAAVADLEVLRTGLALAEDWILELDTDFNTLISVSESYNPGNLVDAAGETTTQLTATGAVVGDFVQISFSLDLNNLMLTGYVDGTASVEGWLQNESTGTVNLLAGTVAYLVNPRATSMLTGAITAPPLSATAFDAAGDMTAFDLTIS